MKAAALEFREVMRGGFAHGVTDPVAGARDGARAGSYLTLWASAAIPDVPRFVCDPEHAGRLTGRVTFTAVGAEQAALDGTFRLFAPTSDPDLKLMIYRATFAVAGKVYCLDGAKYVRRQSVLRAWTATTTLYCRLHEGADPNGRTVAAGVLRLGPIAFARQLATFRTPEAAGPRDTFVALSRFLSFFSRELLDTYWSRRPAQ